MPRDRRAPVEGARRERALASESRQHLAPQRQVLAHPRGAASPVRVLQRSAAHRETVEGQMARRIEEGAPLEEALVAVDESSDVGGIVSPQAAPQDRKSVV